MPPARSATAPRRQRQAQSRGGPRRLVRGARRVRWDRAGRVGLLVTLAIVGLLYVQHTLSYLSTRAQANHQQAIVHQLTRENAQLVQEQKSLNNPATIIRQARALGMVKAGERPYVVVGRRSP